MLERKLILSLICSILASVFLNNDESFLKGWTFLFPLVVFFSLVVSLLAEFLSKETINRRWISMIVHLGLGSLFLFAEISIFSIGVFLIAFFYFLMDECISKIQRESGEKFSNNLIVYTIILFIFSLGTWVISIITY
jgi:hypothetical protein